MKRRRNLTSLSRWFGVSNFQNPIGKYALGIVVLITRFNDLAAYRPQFGDIRDLARRTKPGQVSVLPII